MKKVFDWDKGAKEASAGLAEDWSWTGGVILRGGEPVAEEDTHTYLASTWATPVLYVAGEGDVDCWRDAAEAPGWDAKTFWPESALKILKGE